MILDKIELRGFGCLINRAFDFSPGLNLVVGPNEAGKSTLLLAIQALLYGFFKDSKEWSGEAVRARFEPWSSGPYDGILRLHLSNDEQFQIERVFSPERTKIYRNPGATDVTAAYAPGRHGWVDFADRSLGLTPAVFRASACIHQGELHFDRTHVDALHAKLETLADSGGAEQNAQDAMSILDRWLKDRVNPNAHNVENSRLKSAESVVTNLRSRLKESQEALDEFAGLVAEQNRASAMVASRGRDLDALDGLICWSEGQTLERMIQELTEADRVIADATQHLEPLADIAMVTEAMLDAADRALAEATRLGGVVEGEAARVDGENADGQRGQARLEQIAGELSGLSPSANSSLADVNAARQAVGTWTNASSELQKAVELLDEVRRRRAEWQASLDPRLVERTTVDVDRLRDAVNSAAIRRDDLASAVRELTAHVGDATAEAEYAALQTRLGGLTADELDSTRGLETSYKMATARSSNSRSLPSLVVVAIAALVGLVIGYAAAGVAGAVGGALVAGALAFVGLAGRSGSNEGAAADKIRAALAERLRPFGVESVAELQKHWDRQVVLRDQLAEFRRLQADVTRGETDNNQTLTRLDNLVGVRDVDEARQILGLLEIWSTRKADLGRDQRQAEDKVGQTRHTLDDSLTKARTALADLGLTPDTPDQAKQALDALGADRERRAGLLQERTRLEARLSGYAANLGSLDKSQGQLADAKIEAGHRLQVLGIESDPSAWAADLARCRERFEDYQKYRRGLEWQLERRRALIGTDDPVEWPARAAEFRGRAVPPLDGDTRTLADLRAEREQLESGLTAGRVQGTRLATQREEKASRFADPAELEEQLAEAEAQLARIKRLGDGLRTAKELIDRVAEEQRRDFAPRLEQSLSEWLDRATEHRYHEAKVSPVDLSVKLASAQAGRLVTIDQVSHGTRDAVALLLRATMVDLLSESTESIPLFLDDPLVHVDPSRAQHILALLVELATQRQIFYFTQDPRIEEWAVALGACKVQRLERPG